MTFTKRQEYIKNTFFSKLPEEEATEIIRTISDIGDAIGFIGVNVNQNKEKADKRNHKYDVWISKEVKKNRDIIKRVTDLRFIVDWAAETKVDIFKHDFESAYREQSMWHDEMRRKLQIEKLDIPDVDNERVLFRFSDKNHFMYLLKPEDLKHEGAVMRHCVGGNTYKNKIKNRKSLIVSLRDNDNMPHITVEIDLATGIIRQQVGKANSDPNPKYFNMIVEFLKYWTSYKKIDDLETLKFLNIDFN